MAASPAAIRTPDQRLRVFVSSTLKELEPERRAVRAAIESLHLAPVMFELGARPHPPRELYRSYLAQSDIFVGLYAERYGWVAPGEEVSGLEDEYLLSGGLPGLIYIRDPAPDRDPRLAELLDRIRGDDRSSYKSYSDPDELARLVEGDLVTLLAERFTASRIDRDDDEPASELSDIPAPYTPIIGRERERDDVLALLAQPGVRIVTLVGPGGIGKSRLAIDIAGDVARSGREAGMALLESVTTTTGVLPAIARALGVRDLSTPTSLEDTVIAALGDRDLLLAVDNMEHLLGATDVLLRLLTAAPRLQLLVTSRSPLRLRAEHVYDVGPLAVPTEATDAGAADAAAVALFVQRAAAIRPGFRLTPANLAAVVGICRAVDGVPLAIELAAARIRSLPPEQILARLDSALTLLVDGARDLPERQQTIRGTVQWSVDLLDDDGRDALCTLAVFSGPFAFESAEAVLAATGTPDPLDTLDALLEVSLIQRDERGGATTFRLLSLVRAYASELPSPAQRDAARRAWTDRYVAVAADAGRSLRGPDQLEWLARLDREVENGAAVARALLDDGELDAAAAYCWSLYLYLWIGGYLGVVHGWARELLQAAEKRRIPLAPHSRAVALYYVGAIGFWREPDFDAGAALAESRDLFLDAGDDAGAALAGVSVGLAHLVRPEGPDVPAALEVLTSSLEQFRSAGDTWGQAMALVTLGRIALATGDVDAARSRFDESYELATHDGERLGIVIALNHLGWAKLLAGDLDGGRDDLARGLDISLALRHDEGIAYGLEGFVGLRVLAGDAAAAGRLLGAALRLRRRKGILNPAAFEFYMPLVAGLRAEGSGDEFDRAVAEGERLSVDEVLDDVRD